MPNIYLATPTTRPFDTGFVVSLFQTKNPDVNLWMPIHNKPPDEARNRLGMHFIAHPEPKFDFILFIDSDCIWHSDAAIRLAERNLPVVTGGIYRRRLPPLPTMGMFTGRNPNGHYTYENITVIQRIREFCEKRGIDEKTENALCLEKGDEVEDLMEVDACGSHFLMVRRDVLESMRLPWFRCVGKSGGGEDYYFCRKVKEHDFPIYFDLTVHTGHIVGQGADFGLRELLTYLKWIPSDHAWTEEAVVDVG